MPQQDRYACDDLLMPNLALPQMKQRLLLIVIGITCLVLLVQQQDLVRLPTRRDLRKLASKRDTPQLGTLSVDAIYVVNLPSRRDRRRRLRDLATHLGMKLSFSPAVSSTNSLITRLMENVKRQRQAEGWCRRKKACTESGPANKQLSDHQLNSLYLPDAHLLQDNPEAQDLGLAGADYWEMSGRPPSKAFDSDAVPIPIVNGTHMARILKQTVAEASRNNLRLSHVENASRDQGLAKSLSRAAVACWHSHVLALRTFVTGGLGSALFMEDDVDMEVCRCPLDSLLD
jgi:hypothetical protein